jgi:hypothetical protein
MRVVGILELRRTFWRPPSLVLGFCMVLIVASSGCPAPTRPHIPITSNVEAISAIGLALIVNFVLGCFIFWFLGDAIRKTP